MDDWQGNLHKVQPGSATDRMPAVSASGMTEVFQEADLVRQAQCGNHGAFNALFYGYNQQTWWRRDKQINWIPWEEQGTEQSSTGLSTSEFEEQVAQTDLVQKILRTLPEVQRVCLLLQSVGGFKIHEIAQILNMNPKTVSVYISRAREQFRQTYADLQNEHKRTTKGGQS